jgi:hypothetical protein
MHRTAYAPAGMIDRAGQAAREAAESVVDGARGLYDSLAQGAAGGCGGALQWGGWVRMAAGASGCRKEGPCLIALCARQHWLPGCVQQSVAAFTQPAASSQRVGAPVPLLPAGVRDSLPEVMSISAAPSREQEKGLLGKAADKVKGLVGGGKEEL